MPWPESLREMEPWGHLELLLLEHIGVRGTENIVCQLGLAVDVDRGGSLAAQELAENLSGPVGKLTGHMHEQDIQTANSLHGSRH